MPLTMMSDILFREFPNPVKLRIAASRAFDIASGLVSVAELSGFAPIPADARVVMLHEPEDMPGDFPGWYGLAVDPALVMRVPHAVDAIARSLGTVLLTDAEDDEEMTLHLPDGTHHTVRLAQDDDDAFRITPEMQRLIDAASGRPSTAPSRKAIAS
jgi:hypothetical protein